MPLYTRLFGRNIQPSCGYCENGAPLKDGSMVMCEKKGIVSPYFQCRRFQYAPLKRKPNRTSAGFFGGGFFAVTYRRAGSAQADDFFI